MFPFQSREELSATGSTVLRAIGPFAFSGLGYGGAGCLFAVVGLASRPPSDLPAAAGGCHCAQFCEFWQASRQNCLLKKSAEKFGSGDDLRDSLMHQTGSLIRRLATGLVCPPISGLLRTGSVWWRADCNCCCNFAINAVPIENSGQWEAQLYCTRPPCCVAMIERALLVHVTVQQ